MTIFHNILNDLSRLLNILSPQILASAGEELLQHHNWRLWRVGLLFEEGVVGEMNLTIEFAEGEWLRSKATVCCVVFEHRCFVLVADD